MNCYLKGREKHVMERFRAQEWDVESFYVVAYYAKRFDEWAPIYQIPRPSYVRLSLPLPFVAFGTVDIGA